MTSINFRVSGPHFSGKIQPQKNFPVLKDNFTAEEFDEYIKAFNEAAAEIDQTNARINQTLAKSNERFAKKMSSFIESVGIDKVNTSGADSTPIKSASKFVKYF